MSASRRLGRWRLDRCGLWDDWFWQLEARDEAVDASLELVEYRHQVGRCGGLRHSALDANLAWRCKHGRAFRVRPAGAGALRDDPSVVRGLGRAVLCLSVRSSAWGKALRHCRPEWERHPIRQAASQPSSSFPKAILMFSSAEGMWGRLRGTRASREIHGLWAGLLG